MLVTQGTFGKRTSEMAQFARRESGIRVFMEGFRVLPYGGENDDWLGLDRAVVNKQRTLDIGAGLSRDGFEAVEREGFFLLPNRSYFGAVVLTEAGSTGLDMVVNREGFVPNEAFENLRSLVRTGLDLCVRSRAAVERDLLLRRATAKAEAEAEAAAAAKAAAEAAAGDAKGPSERGDSGDGGGRKGQADAPSEYEEDGEFDPDSSGIEAGEDSLAELLAAARTAAEELGTAHLSPDERYQRAEQLRATFGVVSLRLGAVRDEELILRTLAGLGMQYTAFVHEVNGLLGLAQSLRGMLDELSVSGSRTMPGLQDIRVAADELVQALTRQASYLSDIVGPDARRRRKRMPVAERVESAMRLLRPQLNARRQQLRLDVDPNVQTPPIFPAEFSIVLTNLLTNAIKFAGEDGTIRVAASTDDEGRLHLIVENTGDEVASADRERFFKAFQSSTVEVDAVLGQGMGMGLPIVRSLLAGYDGSAEFVDPSIGYATSVEVVLPDPRRRRRPAAAA